MNKQEILDKLEVNKQARQLLENRLNGGFGQEEGEIMFRKQAELLEERHTLMRALSAVHSTGIFTLNRTFSINPNHPIDSRHQCAAIAKIMTETLLEHYHRDKITKEMYTSAHIAINHQLQFLDSTTTVDNFKTVTTAAIEKAIDGTLSQSSSSLSS